MDPSRISHKSLVGKVIRFPFKLLPSGAVVYILRGPARGQRWIADSTAHGFWLGYWELENQRWFAAHLRPGYVVYDIGAHVGLYSLVSSVKVGSTGHVYGFEPFPRNLQYLSRHIQLNRADNCTIVNAAVSDRSGLHPFDPTLHDTSGYLSEQGSTFVQTVTLDDFLFAHHTNYPPNVLKINAEGAEMAVLNGGRRTITEFSPAIFLSTHSDDIDTECCAFLRSAGYSIRRLQADKIWAEKIR